MCGEYIFPVLEKEKGHQPCFLGKKQATRWKLFIQDSSHNYEAVQHNDPVTMMRMVIFILEM